jgi:5-methylcytosine-specific restriction enzyme B
LKEIDPFTFFGVFNRGITSDKRILIVEELIKFFGVKAAPPKDFDGIPILNNQNSWFISFAAKRAPNDVDRLWDVFVRALGEDPLNDPKFADAFDAAVEVRGTNVNLTSGLFWIRPHTFVSLDGTLREHLGLKLPTAGLSFTFYRDTMEKVRKQHGQDFAKLSRAAYLSGDDHVGAVIGPSAKDIEAIIDGDAQFWFVGAYWDDRDPPGQTDRFLAEGVWENGYTDRYLDLVKQMRPGDRIAIKAYALHLTDKGVK